VKDWERILAEEGMPPELRMLTQSHNGDGHNDGLVCVSMTVEENVNHAAQWAEADNLKVFGEPTEMANVETSVYWRRFSSRIWASGIGGRSRDFLLDYADHGFLSRACRNFGLTRKEGERLIKFVNDAAKENANARSDSQGD